MAVSRVDIHVAELWLPNPTSYSVTEASTAIDPSDTSGGLGQATFAVDAGADDKNLIDKLFRLEDSTQGVTSAIVRSIGQSAKVTTVTADSRLSLLTVSRIAQPFSGTLEDAIRYYLSLVDVTSNIVVDGAIAGITVDLPGWEAEVWSQLSLKLAPALKFEISLVSDNIVFRPWRLRVAENYRDSSRGWTLDRSQSARSIEGYAYNGKRQTGGLAYPHGGWSQDVTIYQVDANEHLSFDIPIEGSLTSIVQPVPVNTVLRNDVSKSVYSVSGGDGLPYVAAQWVANGGSLIVSIGDDTRSIHVELQGPNDDFHSPYRIAVGSSASDYYSSLRILGDGIFFDKQKVTIQTPVDPEKATQEVGVTIDNEFINTTSDFYDAAIWTLATWTGPKRNYSATTTGINRVGDTGSYRYPTIAEFNAIHAGETIRDFNLAHVGMTIADFNDEQYALVSGTFANQAFGNIAGARIYDDYAWNRIRSATINAGSINYTAEADTTIADFNAVWANKTIADFNEWWYDKTLLQFTLQPLSTDNTPQFAIPGGYGSGQYGGGEYGVGGPYTGATGPVGYGQELYGTDPYGD